MASRVLSFQAVIPANTPASAPFSQPINLDGWEIERVDLDVPAGAAGLMGFQVYNNGVPWIPYGAGQWIIWDDVKDSYYLTDQPTGKGWAIVGFNTDIEYTHTVTLRFHVTPANAPASDTTPVAPQFVTTAAPVQEVVTL